jgi:hypothetical protein
LVENFEKKRWRKEGRIVLENFKEKLDKFFGEKGKKLDERREVRAGASTTRYR